MLTNESLTFSEHFFPSWASNYLCHSVSLDLKTFSDLQLTQSVHFENSSFDIHGASFSCKSHWVSFNLVTFKCVFPDTFQTCISNTFVYVTYTYIWENKSITSIRCIHCHSTYAHIYTHKHTHFCMSIGSLCTCICIREHINDITAAIRLESRRFVNPVSVHTCVRMYKKSSKLTFGSKGALQEFFGRWLWHSVPTVQLKSKTSEGEGETEGDNIIIRCLQVWAFFGQKLAKRFSKWYRSQGGLFKLWVIKSRSCFYHSPRSHIGDALWNSEPDSRHNSHTTFGQLCWFSGKCVFVQKVLNRASKTPSNPGEESTFWPNGGKIPGQLRNWRTRFFLPHPRVNQTKPLATLSIGGLVSNLLHPQVHKTQQDTQRVSKSWAQGNDLGQYLRMRPWLIDDSFYYL